METKGKGIKFHKKLMLIRQQLEDQEHPMNIIIQTFDQLFFSVYAPLIEKSQARNIQQAEEFMGKIVKEVQTFMKIIKQVIALFYNIKITEFDFKQELLANLVTTLVMKEHGYAIVRNDNLEDTHTRIRDIYKNMNKYKFKLSLEKLRVSKYF